MPIMRRIFLLFTFFSFRAFAQDDLENIFDDGGMMNARNAVKVNIGGTPFGEYSLSYQRALFGGVCLEGMIGIYSPKPDGMFFRFLSYPLYTQLNGDSKHLTYGLTLQIQPNLWNDAIKPIYSFVGYRNRKMSYQSYSGYSF